MLRIVSTALIAILLLASAEAAQPASPTDDYIATRDRYIARQTAEANTDDIQRAKIAKTNGEGIAEDWGRKTGAAEQPASDREFADLQNRLEKIIGPLTIPGLPTERKINLDDLSGRIGFGMLDGLRYTSPNGSTEVVVTTMELLKEWLIENKSYSDYYGNPLPQDTINALKSGVFYNAAIEDDSAFDKFGDVDIPPLPKVGFQYIAIGLVAQDHPYPPSNLVGAVIRGDRVFILSAELEPMPHPIPTCDAISAMYAAQTTKLVKIGLKLDVNTKSWDQISAQEESLDAQGWAAYRNCFYQHAKQQKSWQRIVQEAQKLVDLVPSD